MSGVGLLLIWLTFRDLGRGFGWGTFGFCLRVLDGLVGDLGFSRLSLKESGLGMGWVGFG